MTSVPALNPSSTEDQVEYQKERQAHETYNTLLKNELFGEMLSKDTVGSESSIDRIKNTRPSTRGNVHTENTTRHGYELERVSTPPPEAAGLEEFSPHSTPVTPRRLFTSQQDEITRPSSNSVRGASLLTYQQRKVEDYLRPLCYNLNFLIPCRQLGRIPNSSYYHRGSNLDK